MASPDRIAYVLGTFPQPSQRFIAREVRGLLAAGMPLQVFSLRLRSRHALEPADLPWFHLVQSVPHSLSPRALAANAWWLRRSPGRYWRALQMIVGLPHRPSYLRLRALALFAIGAWIAREIARSGGCRQVHAHFALAQTEVAMVIGELLGCRFSFTAHARDIYATPSALREKMQAAALVVTCTGYNVHYLRGLCPDIPPDRVRLVHHGVELSDVTGAGSPRDAPPLILAAGRLIEKKGFADLVVACGLLRDRGIRFQCRIAGNGPERAQLLRTIQALSMVDIVQVCPWQAPAELTALMSRATVLAVPSRITESGDRDGIPNVVLEAMGASLPAVATNVSGIPEAVRDDVSGLLVEPGDPIALARALERLLTDRDLARRMGSAGRTIALDEFDLRRSSARLRRLFDPDGPEVESFGLCSSSLVRP